MIDGQTIAVLIPAFNEEQAIAKVIAALPHSVDRIVVADNNSTDRTAEVAKAAGAEVVQATDQGYGAACLSGISHLSKSPPDVLVFLDGDFADDPSYLLKLVAPITSGTAALVIGSRKEKAEKNSLTPPQVFGNWLACFLIRLIWRVKFTDLGPFRAIKWTTLQQLKMVDTNYGWTVEMQIKAAKQKIPFAEIQVPYRQRIGLSKISGTLKGTVLAGTKILYLIGRSVFSRG